MTALPPTLLVGFGGALGAVLRYGISARLPTKPLDAGTLTVNTLGTFLLAVVVLSAADTRTALLVGTGLCGAFTTFSSFAVDTVDAWTGGQRWRALLTAAANLAGAGLAFVAAWLVLAVI
jgi:CrcB protein